MIDRPILIAGAARSGTSITAAMIHYGGAFGGDMRLPDKNKHGAMLENTVIRRDVVKPYFESIGYDPKAQKPLPNLQNLEIWDRLLSDGRDWAVKVKAVITQQGYKGLNQWFYKCPKMCLIWPLWHSAFPKAKWVIVLRDREGIINSCLNTPFMKAYKDREGWGKWIDKHEKCYEEMIDANLDILHTYPEKMINGDFSEIEGVVKSLGLKWEEGKARALINPKFWRMK